VNLLIYLTGDTHGGLDGGKLISFAKTEKGRNLTKNDYVIILGDFGYIFYPERNPKEELELNRFKNYPWTTLFLDGNHENFTRLRDFSTSRWNGGSVHKIHDSLYHLERGQVFNIDGKRLFVMGGAVSIDKEHRREGVSWWSEENVSFLECERALMNLNRYDNKVDFILTHTCPNHFIKKLSSYIVKDPASDFFDELKKSVKFKRWYFGHHHVDLDVGKYSCLYDRIVRLGWKDNVA
jgi:conserved domain protein